MIFNTERLFVRQLIFNDLPAFHELESNPEVLKYADGKVKSITENEKEICDLISRYSKKNNDFWIYAIIRKSDDAFIGTIALVKDNYDDEIGYRFLEKYWGFGYGTEICSGLISYCKRIGMKKLIGYVVNDNIASLKILTKNNFIIIDQFLNDQNQQETKLELKL